MIDTRDLTSYIPGYDAYCDELERESKVDYSDFEHVKNIKEKLEGLVEDIEITLKENTTDKQKIQVIKGLLEDFGG